MDTVVAITFDIIQILLTVAWWIIVAQAILSTLIAFNVINTYNDFVSSLWRGLNTLTEPVYQLEGATLGQAGARARQIRRRYVGAATMMTSTYSLAETLLFAALLSLFFWLAPAQQAPTLASVLAAEPSSPFTIAWPIAYAVVVLFLEPFYVAAGFGMYLTRRAELEAWDIEQEFRRAFPA